MTAVKKSYCKCVLKFTRAYAELAKFKRMLDTGEVLSPASLSELTALTEVLGNALRSLLDAQNACGYTSGLDFLKDDLFDGFAIQNGELVGDLSYAYQIAQPWFCDFLYEKSDNNFLYEVGALIRALTDVDEKYGLKEG